MDTVHFLSAFWGFSLIAICLSLLVKPKHVEDMFKAIEKEVSLMWLGVFTIMLGIASVLTYNVWDQSLGVVVTVINWLVVIKGAMYLLVPEFVVGLLKKSKNTYTKWLPLAMVVGVVLGCLLAYWGLVAI